MYLKEYLEQFKDKKIEIYVDMDGVISDYNVGEPLNFDTKRPLLTSIAKLEEVAKMENIEMHILSITRMTKGYEEKQRWLDINAPFFKKENRNIISREANGFTKSSVLKTNFVKNIKRDKDTVIVIIDDDPSVIDAIRKENKDIFLLKDTALVD